MHSVGPAEHRIKHIPVIPVVADFQSGPVEALIKNNFTKRDIPGFQAGR